MASRIKEKPLKKAVVVELPEYVLGISDRCDRCGAEALVLVKGLSGELTFCGHHFNRYKVKLTEYSYEIVDERFKLDK